MDDIEGQIAALSGKIGEKMTLRRTAAVHATPGIVASYVHNAPPGVSNLGKIGVLVALKSSGDSEKLAALGRQIDPLGKVFHRLLSESLSLTDKRANPCAGPSS